jgi:hypothetical protein
MSSEPIYMPKLGLHMTEGAIAEWLVADGYYCAEGAALVEIETDKTTHEVGAPTAGRREPPGSNVRQLITDDRNRSRTHA